MSPDKELQEAKKSRAHALSLVRHFDDVIKRLEPQVKPKKRDTSEIDARQEFLNNRKFRKSA